MLSLIATVIGAFCGMLYIGFFAYKVGAPPLIVITAICLGLMLYAFYDDIRRERASARARNEGGEPQ